MKKVHLILIGIIIFIAIIGLAIAVYVLKTPSPDLPTNANFFDKVFNFLDEWASAGAPAMMLLAVIVALGIGVATILQTNSIQKKRYKYEQLKEIANWAISITIEPLDIELPFVDLTPIRSEYEGFPGVQDSFKERLKEDLKEYSDFQKDRGYAKAYALSQYIDAIVKESFNELSGKVDEIKMDLTKYIFLRRRKAGRNFEQSTRGFMELDFDIAKNLDKEIKENKEALNALYSKYEYKLPNSVNDLLSEIVKIVPKL